MKFFSKIFTERLFVCIVIKTSTVWDGDVLEQTMLDMHESIIINKKECANKQISISWPFFKHVSSRISSQHNDLLEPNRFAIKINFF